MSQFYVSPLYSRGRFCVDWTYCTRYVSQSFYFVSCIIIDIMLTMTFLSFSIYFLLPTSLILRDFSTYVFGSFMLFFGGSLFGSFMLFFLWLSFWLIYAIFFPVLAGLIYTSFLPIIATIKNKNNPAKIS